MRSSLLIIFHVSGKIEEERTRKLNIKEEDVDTNNLLHKVQIESWKEDSRVQGLFFIYLFISSHLIPIRRSPFISTLRSHSHDMSKHNRGS